MVKVIYGKRGSGKTNRMIHMAKEEALTSPGHVVFVEKDNRCMLDLPHQIRYVNVSEYIDREIHTFFGFIQGMLAANYDIVTMFIDALPSIAGLKSAQELRKFFDTICLMSKKHNINFVLSISGTDDGPEDFLKDYII
ncbi:MAG: hypothetical protein ACOX17_06170 [Christensenellales bacterium]|jgi:hypothetical protein